MQTEMRDRRGQPAAALAYHALRVKQLQHRNTACVRTGVYTCAQPTPAARNPTLHQRAQQKRLVVYSHPEANESS